MPRKKRASSTLAARDTYHVVGPSGDLAVKGPAGPQDPAALALVTAQGQALVAKKAVTLTVERRTLFGPAAKLYRVDRAADGTVITTRLDYQD